MYGSILYSGAANIHLRRLVNLQSHIERSCSFVFQSLSHRRNAAIMGLVCRLLAGEGRGKLQTYCPQFYGNQTLCRSHCLYSWDPAEHLRFVNPCNFRTLDRFKCSWLATAADIWNGLPADLILQGKACGWRTILKDVQRCICTWFVQLYIYVCMRFITVKNYEFKKGSSKAVGSGKALALPDFPPSVHFCI